MKISFQFTFWGKQQRRKIVRSKNQLSVYIPAKSWDLRQLRHTYATLAALRTSRSASLRILNWSCPRPLDWVNKNLGKENCLFINVNFKRFYLWHFSTFLRCSLLIFIYLTRCFVTLNKKLLYKKNCTFFEYLKTQTYTSTESIL